MIELSKAEHIQWPLLQEKIDHITQQFLRILGHTDRHISLYLTDDLEMQMLNRDYRGLDHPTDILSWSYGEENPDSEYLGELSISIERVQAQAIVNGWSDETEFIRLLAHGCAHLAGYDHEESREADIQMLRIEIQMLEQIGMAHVYKDNPPSL